ncbi:MAG: RdgB/HAM1 family non-canonical purine NTP pyrophosphatase [Candidatus Gastranaerophilaceae bacterium]
MKIVFATSNPHKLQEVNDISSNCSVEFVLPKEDFNPVENGFSFEENSLIKAKEAYRVSKMMTLADDSGLCVDALNGAPGLYSARYAGSQDEKINKLLNELEGVENRSAKFTCCMSLLDENGDLIYQVTENCNGEIVKKRKGVNGFGYDPIFLVNGYNLTMAELSAEEKNKVSHRGKALNKILDYIKENLI